MTESDILSIIFDCIKYIVASEYKININITVEKLDLSWSGMHDLKNKTITLNKMVSKGTKIKEIYYTLLHEAAHVVPPKGTISLAQSWKLEAKYKKLIEYYKEHHLDQVGVHNVIFLKEFERLKRKYPYRKLMDINLKAKEVNHGNF